MTYADLLRRMVYDFLNTEDKHQNHMHPQLYVEHILVQIGYKKAPWDVKKKICTVIRNAIEDWREENLVIDPLEEPLPEEGAVIGHVAPDIPPPVYVSEENIQVNPVHNYQIQLQNAMNMVNNSVLDSWEDSGFNE